MYIVMLMADKLLKISYRNTSIVMLDYCFISFESLFL